MNIFAYSINLGGELSEPVEYRFAVPVRCQLVHACASGNNGRPLVLTLGSLENDQAHLERLEFGADGYPVEVNRDGFTGGEYPWLDAGEVLVVGVDPGPAAAAAGAGKKKAKEKGRRVNIALAISFTAG
jgi:hypothetical protein